ncbi:NAD(P)-dependent oxidoreductase [Mycobacterium sp. 236(2023)]|uniref:NAD-dependent epimerase/dehydratase family protein n=1 Tax=Mycobacterium sp. 236(2023) TaxID=3038163 RepID=UPI0024157D87|nr:NAD(P)-dependent oxidoreductase [Mycobacterium sp. 236(2023)]MDG4668027.1 NAD(P)-dependent oxidoreductase [Mycobacterium sp. 236(2023)]
MTVLITGATGLVGSRLLPRLIDAGIDCRAMVRVGKSLPPGVTAVEGDLLAPGSLRQAVDGISAVVHLAAVLRTPDTDQIRHVNLDGTANLVESVRTHAPHARVIMASTGLVYGPDLPRPAREDDRVNPTMPYPASKLEAERVLRRSGLTWSILRLGFVYGDGDGHLHSAPQLLGSWQWHPAQTLSLVHHRDVATAVLLALTGATDGRVVNIVDDGPASVYDIARLVGADYLETAEPLTNPWNGHLDGSLARSLGFRPSVATMYQASADDAV